MPRIGILNPARAVGSGGYFQYMLALIEGLRPYGDLEVAVFYDDPGFQAFCFDSPNFTWVALEQDRGGIGTFVRALSTLANLRSPWVGRFGVLRRYHLDCLISPASLVGFHLRIPFVGIIFDVMYKYYPDCAEYPVKERVARDLINARLVRHAVLNVVDSERSRDDLVQLYHADPGKIRPIPLCAPPHVYRHRQLPDSALREVAARYELPSRFVFYPAQLWDHKNHRRLFEALALLRDQHGIEVPCVLVGSAGANGGNVLGAISELGLQRQVRHLGYVAEEDLAAIYRKATALVYPSFADYTNIPVLEAMVLGTPVLCSNAFAMPEQVGDAGLLFDPFDVKDIAEQVRRVWTDERLRQELVQKGRERVETLSLEHFGRRWREAIEEALGGDGARGE